MLGFGLSSYRSFSPSLSAYIEEDDDEVDGCSLLEATEVGGEGREGGGTLISLTFEALIASSNASLPPSQTLRVIKFLVWITTSTIVR